MLTDREQYFVESLLDSPPLQQVEETASESHETRRIPDPYIFVVKNGKLQTPNGQLVENSMDKTSYLGIIELQAFQEIQAWSESNSVGSAVWFSPPFPEKYPVSKIIITEISASNELKILFNRAVILDKDAEGLMELANDLANEGMFSEPEKLRETPLFPDPERLTGWLDKLRTQTDQADLMILGADLRTKTDTYAKISEIHSSLPVYGRNSFYAELYKAANENGLIGDKVGSCPWQITTTGSTPVEKFLSQSFTMGERKILCCTCPSCKEKVEAEIHSGKIHCPKCKASANWKN